MVPDNSKRKESLNLQSAKIVADQKGKKFFPKSSYLRYFRVYTSLSFYDKPIIPVKALADFIRKPSTTQKKHFVGFLPVAFHRMKHELKWKAGFILT